MSSVLAYGTVSPQSALKETGELDREDVVPAPESETLGRLEAELWFFSVFSSRSRFLADVGDGVVAEEAGAAVGGAVDPKNKVDAIGESLATSPVVLSLPSSLSFSYPISASVSCLASRMSAKEYRGPLESSAGRGRGRTMVGGVEVAVIG